MNIRKLPVLLVVALVAGCDILPRNDPPPRYSIGPAKAYLVSGKQQVLVCLCTRLQLPPVGVWAPPPRTLESNVQVYLCDVETQRGMMLGNIAAKESRIAWTNVGIERWMRDAVYVYVEGYSEVRGGRLVEQYRFGLDGDSFEVPNVPDEARRVGGWQGMSMLFAEVDPPTSFEPPFYARLGGSGSPDSIMVELGRGSRIDSERVWTPTFQIWPRSGTIAFIGQQPTAGDHDSNRNGLPN